MFPLWKPKKPSDPPPFPSPAQPLYFTAHAQSLPCFSLYFSTLCISDLPNRPFLTLSVTRCVDVGLAKPIQIAIIPDRISWPLYSISFQLFRNDYGTFVWHLSTFAIGVPDLVTAVYPPLFLSSTGDERKAFNAAWWLLAVAVSVGSLDECSTATYRLRSDLAHYANLLNPTQPPHDGLTPGSKLPTDLDGSSSHSSGSKGKATIPTFSRAVKLRLGSHGSHCLSRIRSDILPRVTWNQRIRDWIQVKGQIDYVEMGNGWILFKFTTVQDREYVWLNRPWFVSGLNLFLKPWIPLVDPYVVNITHVNQWLTITRSPQEFWDDAQLTFLLSGVGIFLKADEYTLNRGKGRFAQVCLNVDVTKPLRGTLTIPTPEAILSLPISYEGLHEVCAIYSSTAHALDTCSDTSKNVFEVTVLPRKQSRLPNAQCRRGILSTPSRFNAPKGNTIPPASITPTIPISTNFSDGGAEGGPFEPMTLCQNASHAKISTPSPVISNPEAEVPIYDEDDIGIFLNLEGDEDPQHSSDCSKKRRSRQKVTVESHRLVIGNSTRLLSQIVSEALVCFQKHHDMKVLAWNVQDRPYTWKSRIRGQLIYEKLDRVIGRQDWANLYPAASLTHGPFSCSYHYFILLNTQGSTFGQKQPTFQFQLDWIQHEQVNRIIHYDNALFVVRQCSVLLISLSVSKLSSNSGKSPQEPTTKTRLRKIRKNYTVENHFIDNADSPRLNHWHQRLMKQREKLMLFHQRFWGHAARKHWLTDARKKRTFIARIKNEIGGWIEESNLIQAKFCHDFQQRFTSSHNQGTHFPILTVLRKATHDENRILIQQVTEEEIHQALFQMNPYKAPGSDGFGAVFFQKYWTLLKDRLCLAIQDFFGTGKLLK
ncbi:LOW QUALITY PROTEIN: hypothetical protein Cgig2_015825 [Carnegiea gigantea]|uniref:DUF4283 domain-containing protein n=1 Tax=Carnegiea gigantea TaxID=171969 RepID=A0A9Q1KH14_9CARY|nr:LOW QUALITY PROTEIN: hypothetical protein Cgig2_015825 [Carnegiea gigantea]